MSSTPSDEEKLRYTPPPSASAFRNARGPGFARRTVEEIVQYELESETSKTAQPRDLSLSIDDITPDNEDAMGDDMISNRGPGETAMPLRTERRAPTFNGQGTHLRQYFNDFETLADVHKLARVDYVRKALEYIRVEDYDLWKQISDQVGTDWEMFKKKIAPFYVGADDDRKHCMRDIEKICETQALQRSVSRSEFSEFYRKFFTIATYLVSKERLSEREVSRLLINSFNLAIRSKIRAQLQATDPNHHPDDAWSSSEVVAAIHIVLASSVED